MGELFWNKIIGAILATFLTVFALTELSHMLIHPHELEEPAYPIEVPDMENGGGEPEVVDVGLLLREASVASGENLAGTLCSSCHTFNEGGAASTGPNLWNVVGRTAGTKDGFAYSGAMTDYGQEWTYERLWSFIERPAGEVQGTAMTFAGLRRENQRADIIAYLGSLSDNPRPFPEPLPEEPAAEVADAAGDAVAGAVEGATDAIGDGAAAVQDAVENTAEGAADALEDAEATLEGAVDAVVDPDPEP